MKKNWKKRMLVDLTFFYCCFPKIFFFPFYFFFLVGLDLLGGGASSSVGVVSVVSRFVVEGNIQQSTNDGQVLHGLDLFHHFSLLGVLEVDVLADSDGNKGHGEEEGEELTAEVDDHHQGAGDHDTTSSLGEEGSFGHGELEAGDELGDLDLGFKDPGEVTTHDLLGGTSGFLDLHGTSSAEDGDHSDDSKSSKEGHFFCFVLKKT